MYISSGSHAPSTVTPYRDTARTAETHHHAASPEHVDHAAGASGSAEAFSTKHQALRANDQLHACFADFAGGEGHSSASHASQHHPTQDSGPSLLDDAQNANGAVHTVASNADNFHAVVRSGANLLTSTQAAAPSEEAGNVDQGGRLGTTSAFTGVLGATALPAQIGSDIKMFQHGQYAMGTMMAGQAALGVHGAVHSGKVVLEKGMALAGKQGATAAKGTGLASEVGAASTVEKDASLLGKAASFTQEVPVLDVAGGALGGGVNLYQGIKTGNAKDLALGGTQIAATATLFTPAAPVGALVLAGTAVYQNFGAIEHAAGRVEQAGAAVAKDASHAMATGARDVAHAGVAVAKDVGHAVASDVRGAEHLMGTAGKEAKHLASDAWKAFSSVW